MIAKIYIFSVMIGALMTLGTYLAADERVSHTSQLIAGIAGQRMYYDILSKNTDDTHFHLAFPRVTSRAEPSSAQPSSAQPSSADTLSSQDDEVNEWDEVGDASWYGGRFQGRQTANGEIFDTHLLTAAHKTLPFNSMVQVYNPSNSKSVLVRINDRGPFVEGRIIDLSRAAAEELGLTSTGIGTVYLRVISEGEANSMRIIQIASFSEYSNAVDLLRELEAVGLTVHIEDSDTIFRIIIPNVPLQEVEQQRAQLASLGYSDVLVRVAK